MKINSRFTDFYDFYPSVSFDDPVVYNREFKETEAGNLEHDLVLLIGDNAWGFTWRRKFYSLIYPKPQGGVPRYCHVHKCIVKGITSNHTADYFGVFSQKTQGSNKSSVDGKLFLTQPLQDVLLSYKYAKAVELASTTDIRGKLEVHSPVALIFADGGHSSKVFEDFSLSASGLLPVLQRLGFNPSTTSSEIDMYLVRNSEVPDNRTDNVKIEANGFDKKESFRTRKGTK